MPNEDPTSNAAENTQPGTLLIQAARAQIIAARQRREALAEAGQLPGNSSGAATFAGKSFPGYQLLRELHRGGQGVVYAAKQESTDRQVAIKILRHGPLAQPDELARFRREVEVLSLLRHPHVVTIHDCGRADESVFLVMDYIAGHSLDGFVAKEKPSISDILRLFAKICDGVNAAHLRGIIHRDLKPSNIRVDEQGEPRVLDFGLAKLCKQDDEASPAGVTHTGQFVGSLPWASPEQVSGNAELLDVRSDVYSLGVILFQLLTGGFPYPVSGRMDDVVRHIAQTDPARPSTTVRGIDADVETIVLKCLAKEPERRYQSAGELARDIRHFLANEPIAARRDSAAYVLRKQLHRHRAALAVALAFALLLTGGFAVSLSQWYRAEQALIDKEEQRKLATLRADQTQKVADFQSKILNEIDVEAMGRGIKQRYREQVRAAIERQYIGVFPERRKRSVEEVDAELAAYDERAGAAQVVDVARHVMDEYVLKPAAESLQKQFTDQPLVQTQIWEAIGNSYHSLGMFDAALTIVQTALEIRQRELGAEHELVANSLNETAVLIFEKGEYAAAEPIHRQALAMRRKILGEEHSAVAASLGQLADTLRAKADYAAAEPLAREALAMNRKVHGNEHVSTATSLDLLGRVLDDKGDNAAAEESLSEALKLRRKLRGDHDLEVANYSGNLAAVLTEKGDYAASTRLQQEALAIRQNLLGYDHPLVATNINSLGYALHKKGDYAAAESMYREALVLRRKLFGDEHPDVGRSLNNVAVVLQETGKFDEAERFQREALTLRRKLLGDSHPDVARTVNNLGILLMTKGDNAAAESVLREALALRRKAHGDEHSDVAFGMCNLGKILALNLKYDEAESLLREALAMQRRLLGDENRFVALTLSNLAIVLQETDRETEAESLHREVLALRRKLLGDQHAEVASSMSLLASFLRTHERYEEAEELIRQALAIYQASFKDGHIQIAIANDQLAMILIELGHLPEAEGYILDSVAMHRRVTAGDHTQKAAALATLALYLHRTDRSEEAKAAIIEGSDMILRLFPPDHKNSRPILERRKAILGE